MIFSPKHFSRKPYLTTLFGTGLIAILALIEAVRLPWGVWALVSAGVGVASLAAFVYVALGYCRLVSLRYRVTRDGIVVEDCLGTTTIPTRIVRKIDKGWKAPGRTGGHWLGRTVPESGSRRKAQMHATRPPEEQMLIVTSGRFDYGVSPEDEKAFVAAFEKVREMGAIRSKEEGFTPLPWRRALPFDDVYFWAFGVTGGIWLALLALVDVIGMAISGRALLAAFAFWLLDMVLGVLAFRKDRTAARILWLGGLLAAFVAGL